MKSLARYLLIVTLLAPAISLHAAAWLGTAFTYQGHLKNGSNPAQGLYDFTFTLYDVIDEREFGQHRAGPHTLDRRPAEDDAHVG